MSEASALDTVSVKAGSRIGLCRESDPCATVFPYATVWDTICLLVYIAYVCTLVIVGPNEDHNNEDNDNEDKDNKVDISRTFLEHLVLFKLPFSIFVEKCKK